MKNLKIIGISLFIFMLGMVVSEMLHKNYGENFLMTQWTLYPDEHLSTAKSDLEHKSYNHSIHEIDRAIMAIRALEAHSDKKIIKMLDSTIEELYKVENEIKSGNINIDHLELASAHALNALALMHLELTKKLDDKGKNKKAIKSIRTAITHLQNTIELSHNPKLKKQEEIVVHELKILLDSLEKNGHLNDKDYTISVNDLVKIIK